MSGYEFDPKDKDGSLRDRFDCYCKEVIGRAAHNLVFKQAQYLILHFGGGEIDPSMMMHEDEHDKIEVHLMPVDAEAVDFTGVLEIEVGFRKKAAVKIFMTAEFPDVCITVDGKSYEAEPLGNGFYRVDMPDLKKPGTYSVDVYSGDNIVAEKLTLIVKREGQREKDLL